MTDHLTRLVESFAGRSVLLVGDLILDRYVYGDAERISPEAPVPVLRVVEQREAVGGSANVAACLRALGCRVFCCGMAGRDRHGEHLLALLHEIGVETTPVVRPSDRPTTTKTRLVGLAQHRHRQQLLRVDEEDARPLSPEEAKQIQAAALALVEHVDVICIEDYDKGVVSEPLVQAVTDRARQQRKPVLVDPARLTSYSRYIGADVLTPNRTELALATGGCGQTLPELAEAARSLLEPLGVRAVVATVDREGALLVERGRPWLHVPTTPRSVYDNTGAGDAVLAMLAAAVASGADLKSATELANVAGGLEVERFGCVPITAGEVLAELRLVQRFRNGKLRSLEELVAELTLRRDRGETVAFTNGCFDLLHAGHVELLRRCRQEASILVVGLNSDASVRAQGKGPERPINAFAHRAAVLGALECVDYVVGFDEPTPERLIRGVRPDVLIKGEDWAGKGVVGQQFVESTGGRVVLVPLVESFSTTALLERIRRAGPG
ncbi:MAG TPA: bifunctional heptose 7-phosphate kinase/heptose 1-phosphate adenyltransferase [Phycisphaerae bacterium]|nr:bifunctional heptose 7-phosphate kinase/heptose 1-phosphate adenyltransferase [Phycisphaerae bacterium]HNU44963.1 bifunctional heptose 7-phosphate kinase/heptose 1-phosphate adenyltransferase [Phycisphaerae bacterium]